MQTLHLTGQQEIFALKVHAGLNYSDAYRKAYDVDRMRPETIHAEASRLASNHKVAHRLDEMRSEADALRLLDERQVLVELMSNSVQAREEGNLAASNKALELLGRYLGLWNDQPKTNKSVVKLFAWLTEPSESGSGL